MLYEDVHELKDAGHYFRIVNVIKTKKTLLHVARHLSGALNALRKKIRMKGCQMFFRDVNAFKRKKPYDTLWGILFDSLNVLGRNIRMIGCQAFYAAHKMFLEGIHGWKDVRHFKSKKPYDILPGILLGSLCAPRRNLRMNGSNVFFPECNCY